MIFGNKSQFAVEAILDSEYKMPNSIFGRACCWIDGKPLGDLNEGDCILGTLSAHLNLCLSNFTEHKKERFAGVSDEEAFRQINENVYVYDEEKIEKKTEDLVCYNFLTGCSEAFDSFKSFAISDSDTVRFLIEEDEVNELRFTRIGLDVVSKAIHDFIDWHEEQIIANRVATGVNSRGSHTT